MAAMEARGKATGEEAKKPRVASATALPVPDYEAPAIPSDVRRRILSEQRGSWSNFRLPGSSEELAIANPLAPIPILGARGSSPQLESYILAAGIPPEVGACCANDDDAVDNASSSDRSDTARHQVRMDLLEAAPEPPPPAAPSHVRSPLSQSEQSLRDYRISTMLGAAADARNQPTGFVAMQNAFEIQLNTLLELIKGEKVILCNSSAELDTASYFTSGSDGFDSHSHHDTQEHSPESVGSDAASDSDLSGSGNAYSAVGRTPGAHPSPEDRRESRFMLRRRAKQLLTGAGSRSSTFIDATAAARAMGGPAREMEELCLPSGASHDLAPVYKAVVRSKKSIIDYARKKSDLPYIKGYAPAPVEGDPQVGALKDTERETDVYRCLDAFLCALEAKTGLPSGRIRTLIGSVQFDELQQEVVTLVNQKQKVRLMYTQLSQELASVQSTLEHVEELAREDERKYSKTQAIRTDTAKQGVLAQAKELTNTREIAFLWEVQLDKIFEDCTLKMHRIYSEFLEMHRLIAEEPQPTVTSASAPDLRASVARGMATSPGVMQAVDLRTSGSSVPVAKPMGDPHLQYFLERRGFSQHIPLLCGKNITFSHFSCLADVDLAELGVSPAADCLAMHSAILTIQSSSNGTKIVKEGWMLKQGERVKNWKRRYFVLRSSNELLYFRDQACTRQCGVLDLNKPCSVSKHIVDSDKLQHCFRVNTIGRTWIFSCGNVSERNEWLQLLNSIVNYNRLRTTPSPSQ